MRGGGSFVWRVKSNRVSSASKDPRPFGGLSSACWRGLRRTNSILCKSREWPRSVSWECPTCVYRPAHDISRKVCSCSVIRIFDGWDRARPTGSKQHLDEKCAILNRKLGAIPIRLSSTPFESVPRFSPHRAAPVNLMDSQWLQQGDIASSKPTRP